MLLFVSVTIGNSSVRHFCSKSVTSLIRTVIPAYNESAVRLYTRLKLRLPHLCGSSPQSSYSDPLNPSIFEASNFREVFRSLDVELCVTKTSIDPDHPTRPKIYFFGEMGDTSSSMMNGWVQMTPDDQVQWHFVSAILFTQSRYDSCPFSGVGGAGQCRLEVCKLSLFP